MAKQDFTALINKAKETKIETPIQKVVPVKEKKEETIFSFYIPTDKLKKLKIISAEKDIKKEGRKLIKSSFPLVGNGIK